MCTHQYQNRNMTKNHGNMTPPKNAHKAPITESNEMAIYELAHKEFIELKENTNRQLETTEHQ